MSKLASARRRVFEMNGSNLTIETLLSIARGEVAVHICPAAAARVAAAHEVVLRALESEVLVYGLTTHLGWHRETSVFSPSEKSPKKSLHAENASPRIAASKAFNAAAIRAHAAAAGGSFLPEETVRACMAARLNGYLTGETGISPAVVDMLAFFLNEGITPRIPSAQPIGQPELTQLSHLGLAIMGEWEVQYDGAVHPSAEVFARFSREAVAPVGKDALALMAANPLFLAKASQAISRAKHFLDRQPVMHAFALEALNGNVSPVLERVACMTGVPEVLEVAAHVRQALAGSYLWDVHDARKLQDPLSFRAMPHVIAHAWEGLRRAERHVNACLNHSQDNPSVYTGTLPKSASSQEAKYFLQGGPEDERHGAVYPTANFETILVTSAVEELNQRLARLSSAIAMQNSRLLDDEFTSLSRGLRTPGSVHALSGIEKTYVALNRQIVQYAAPASLWHRELAGGAEDFTTASMHAADFLSYIVDNLEYLDSMRLLIASQAVDMRGAITLGRETAALHKAYRAAVPFTDADRAYSQDIEAGRVFVQQQDEAESDAEADAGPETKTAARAAQGTNDAHDAHQHVRLKAKGAWSDIA